MKQPVRTNKKAQAPIKMFLHQMQSHGMVVVTVPAFGSLPCTRLPVAIPGDLRVYKYKNS